MNGYPHVLRVLNFLSHPLGGLPIHVDLPAAFNEFQAHTKGFFVLYSVLRVGNRRKHQMRADRNIPGVEYLFSKQPCRFYIALHILAQRCTDIDVFRFRIIQPKANAFMLAFLYGKLRIFIV